MIYQRMLNTYMVYVLEFASNCFHHWHVWLKTSNCHMICSRVCIPWRIDGLVGESATAGPSLYTVYLQNMSSMFSYFSIILHEKIMVASFLIKHAKEM